MLTRKPRNGNGNGHRNGNGSGNGNGNGKPKVHVGDFDRRLECRARKLLAGLEKKMWSSSAISAVERDMALALNEIERVREVHREVRHNLLKLECYVDTDYLALNRQLNHYSADFFLERNKLKRKLWQIEKERRQLALAEEQKLQPLHERLLVLLSRHRQLKL